MTVNGDGLYKNKGKSITFIAASMMFGFERCQSGSRVSGHWVQREMSTSAESDIKTTGYLQAESAD